MGRFRIVDDLMSGVIGNCRSVGGTRTARLRGIGVAGGAGSGIGISDGIIIGSSNVGYGSSTSSSFGWIIGSSLSIGNSPSFDSNRTKQKPLSFPKHVGNSSTTSFSSKVSSPQSVFCLWLEMHFAKFRPEIFTEHGTYTHWIELCSTNHTCYEISLTN